MNLVKCPRCGEAYSPSYRTCPFCEEEEHPRKLKNKNRGGHRVTEKKKTHSGKGALVAILILVLALLTWYLFGERIVERFAGSDKSEPSVEDTVPRGTDADPFYDPNAGEIGESTASDPNAGEPPVVGDPAAENPVVDQPTNPTVVPSQLAIGSNVNKELPKTPEGQYDCTVGRNENIRLIVTGTDASVTWSIKNPSVAAISADGTITPVSTGVTTATATVGGMTLSCIVRIS